MALVDYQIVHDGVPKQRGLAYDYLLGGDGLYLMAQNRHLQVRVPVATVAVRRLPPIYPYFALQTDRLPQRVWDEIVAVARSESLSGREVLLTVTYDDRDGYRLLLPRQIASPESVVYRPVPGSLLEIHSHRHHAAYFSPTDDADEQRLCLYGVLGRLGSDCPEVALRVGAYGHFLRVPWDALFKGEIGTFRDASFDLLSDPEAEGAGSGL